MALLAADPRPWHRMPRLRASCTMPCTIRKYPGKSLSSMTPSSFSMRARSSSVASGYLRGTASHTRCRSHDIGVCPSGTFCFGSAGLARRSGKAISSASVDRARDRAGVAREALLHLGPRAQVRAGVRGQPSVELVEPTVGANSGDRRGELLALRHGVVHVVAREHRQPALGGERGEQVVLARVERAAVVDQLDVHGIPSEQRHEAIESGCRRLGPAVGERAPHGALAAAGQDRPVTFGLRGELVEVVDRADPSRHPAAAHG